MTFKSLHGKPCFLFPDLLKRWSFQNSRPGIWYFSYYWERSCFFFPKTRSYTLDGKWKMIFLKKSKQKYDISFRPYEQMVFSKRTARGRDISCIIWKDDIFFLNTRYYFLRQETRDGLSQEIQGNMIFSVDTYGCYKRVFTPLCQKKKKKKKSKMALSGKNTPTGGWPSRMTFRNSNVVNGGHVLQRKPKETIILNKYDLKWKETLEKCKWEHRTR